MPWSSTSSLVPRRATKVADDVLATPRVGSEKLQNIVDNLYKGTTTPIASETERRWTRSGPKSKLAYRLAVVGTRPRVVSRYVASTTGSDAIRTLQVTIGVSRKASPTNSQMFLGAADE